MLTLSVSPVENDRREASHRLGKGDLRSMHIFVGRVQLFLSASLVVATCNRNGSPRDSAVPRNQAATGGRHSAGPSGSALQLGWAPATPLTFTTEPATEREIVRELTFTTDPKTRTPRMIDVRPGVDVSIDIFWRRYASILRVPPDELVQTAPPRPSSTLPGHVLISYQQVHLGYPVAGYGYLVDADRGLFRSATGKIMPDLPSALPEPIDRGAALDVALRYLKLSGPPPWEPSRLPVAGPGGPLPRHLPEASLVLWASRFDPLGSDFSLTWVLRFTGTGLKEPGTMEIEAATGRVLSTSPGSIR
jgi:hypothetical protein